MQIILEKPVYCAGCRHACAIWSAFVSVLHLCIPETKSGDLACLGAVGVEARCRVEVPALRQHRALAGLQVCRRKDNEQLLPERRLLTHSASHGRPLPSRSLHPDEGRTRHLLNYLPNAQMIHFVKMRTN